MYCEIKNYVEQPMFISVAGWVTRVAEKQIEMLHVSDLPVQEQERRVALIWDKVIHTGDSVQAAIDIVSRYPTCDPKLRTNAVLMALLHDVGRFEQAARFGLYSDHRTGFSHAHVGSQMMRNDASFFMTLGMDEETIDVISDAIWWHSDYSYDGGDIAPKLLRDIDKLSLLRRIDYQTRHYPPGPPTEQARTEFDLGHMVPNTTVRTKGDGLLRMYSWQYDICLGKTRQIIAEESLMEQLQSLLQETLNGQMNVEQTE
jgi:hypothetical protein